MIVTNSSVGHMPESKRWEFDESVAECFDDMLVRSIPLYEDTLDLIARMVAKHVAHGDTILDLGVSSGNALLRISERLCERGLNDIRLVGADNSPEMLSRAAKRLPESTELIEVDLSQGWPYRLKACTPKVILSLWTAQFIPIEHRALMFANARSSILQGGCMFVTEKLRGQTSEHQVALAKIYEQWKVDSGYSLDSIRAKAKSLEGVLVSLSAPEMKGMLMNDGWNPEEVIRYLGFAGYYCLPN